jgi:hypothetical protein
LPLRIFHVQNRRKPFRCHPTTVEACTMWMPDRQSRHRAEPSPEQAVRTGQFWPFEGSLKDRDLMAKRKNLQLERPAAPKQAEERRKYGPERQSTTPNLSIRSAFPRTTISRSGTAPAAYTGLRGHYAYYELPSNLRSMYAPVSEQRWLTWDGFVALLEVFHCPLLGSPIPVKRDSRFWGSLGKSRTRESRTYGSGGRSRMAVLLDHSRATSVISAN